MERGVEQMLSLESLGIHESDNISHYDQIQIDKFAQNIKLVNNKVSVQLVWNENFNRVPSNHNVCLAILNRALAKLEREGLEEKYCQYFDDQLNDGIIEEFECAPEEFKNFNWLPHRPVFKRDRSRPHP